MDSSRGRAASRDISHQMESPRDSNRRNGLFAGAKAYLRSRSKSPKPARPNSKPDLDTNGTTREEFMIKSKSETALSNRISSPSSPTSLLENKWGKKHLEKKKAKRSNSSKRTESTADSSVDSHQTDPLSSGRSPKKKGLKLRVSSLVMEGYPKDDSCVQDTELAAVVRKNRRKFRRSSLGAYDIPSTDSHHAITQDNDEKNKIHATDAIKHTRSVEGLIGRFEKANSSGADVVSGEEQLNDIPSKRRSRSNAKVKRKSKKDKAYDSDGDYSRKSTSSKRSKGSKVSAKSNKSARRKDKEIGDGRKKRSGSKKMTMDDLPGDCRSEYSGRSSGSKSKGSKRRERTMDKSEKSPKKDSDRETIGSLPIFPKDGENVHGKNNESFSSNISEKSFKITNNLVDVNPLRIGDLESEVDVLNKHIVELKEENLKAQFQAQSEAAKLRKELREEKLELQRSQTERRELRAELREREFTLNESDLKIEALEQAVESQLDKVEDLEEELKRANEEIFELEEKLSHMETVLADSAALEGNGVAKEREMGEKRHERLQRRLEEREKELEERERNLREERDSVIAKSHPQREVEQLEQDNRMLLKALNREKAEAVEAAKAKESEMEAMRKELKKAKMRSYSQISKPSPGQNALAKLMKEKEELLSKLRAEESKKSSASHKKDDTIAFLEMEVSRLKEELKSRDMGDFDHLKRDMEALQAECKVMKSKFEGAQRRNLILEDDIDHWKSVNCNLENEVAEWKGQAANWRGKYESSHAGGDDGSPEVNILPFRMSRNVGGSSMSAAGMSLSRRDDSDDESNAGNRTISNLWSKLTTPAAKKQSEADSFSRPDDALSRSTFH